MIDKNEILNMVRQVTRRASGGGERRIIRPERDWFVGLFLSLLIVVGGFAYQLNKFFYYLEVENHVVAKDTTTQVYRTSDLEAVLEVYETRAATSRDLLDGYEFVPPITTEDIPPTTDDITAPE